ncbi:MAG: methyltransferase [Thermoanaerobaculales bacterium]
MMTTNRIDLDQLQSMLWSFAGHRVITVATRAGILRFLAERDASPPEVARELGLEPTPTGKVIRALSALGLVEPEGASYRVVESLRPCFLAGENDLSPFIEHAHSMYEGWGANLEPWLRGGEWPSSAASPEHARAFGAAMRAMGTKIAASVAAALELGGVERVLDVGGGFGQYSRALCEQNDRLCATVLDTPEVAELAVAELAGGPFADRIDFLPGDYLSTNYGAGYDLALFANVLHQEPAENAAEMVRRGAAALAPGGRVVVVDFVIDDEQREHVFGALFAINMRSFGDTWPEPTIRGWMEAAGLGEISRSDIDRDRWIIQGRKQG